MRVWLIISLLILCGLGLDAQTVSGRLISGNRPIAFAVIQSSTGAGAVSKLDGRFVLETDKGDQSIYFQALGYASDTLKLKVNNDVDLGDYGLKEESFGLGEVVVTGTMRPTLVYDAPIKINVVGERYLRKLSNPVNLVESMNLVPGVQEVVACGVCFTNNISINGLPGQYTAVLIDGSPMYGNLSGIYGLNGISNQMIEQIEIIKGPNSTLYGSEAMAGVINIITKDPELQPTLAVDVMGTSHLEAFTNISHRGKVGKWTTYTGINTAYLNHFEDANEDGFNDEINMDRIGVFSKWTRKSKKGYKTTVNGKVYYEDRRNGVEEYLKNRAYSEIRGNDSIYGESILTNRYEVFGTSQLSKGLHFDFSTSLHDQNSYYGDSYFEARQILGFSNLRWLKQTKSHSFTSGLTVRADHYDDNTFITEDGSVNKPLIQVTPGVFVQDEWRMDEQCTFMPGLRLDYYSEHGLIFSPRLSYKLKLGEWTNIRLNTGTGFKVVNLFTEDHAFVTGQRQVEILEELNPERSLSGDLNIFHVFSMGKSTGTIDAGVFVHHFTNKILPDYSQEGKILYANAGGFVQSRGVNLSIGQQYESGLSWNATANFLEVFEKEDEVKSAVPFAPEWTIMTNILYGLKKYDLNFGYVLRYTGPMTLPQVFDLDETGQPLVTSRATISKPFALHSLQVSKGFAKQGLSVYGGVRNLFGYVQPSSPLVGYNDPNSAPGFSEYFDTSYAYSPSIGREFYVGLRWNLDPRSRR